MKITTTELATMTPAQQAAVGLAVTAKIFAEFAAELPEYSRAHSQLWKHLSPGVNQRDWLAMYRRSKRNTADIVASLLPEEMRLGAVPAMVEAIRLLRVVSTAPELRPIWLAFLKGEPLPSNAKRDRNWRRFHTLTKLIMRTLAGSLEADALNDDALGEAITHCPACRFLMCVELPCWIYGGDYSVRLMRRARQGDMGAIEILLKIDKSVMADPRISRIYYQAAQQRDKLALRMFADAIKAEPPKFNARKAKATMAGFVSQLFMPFGGLTSTQVLSIFDQVAHEQTKGKQQRDMDLPAGESLSKAIQRHRPKWAAILPAGQNAP